MVESFSVIPIQKYTRSRTNFLDDGVITEQAVSLTVNRKVWLSFMCTPINLEELAVGFLYNEKIINSSKEIMDIYVCDHKDNIDIWLNRDVEEPKNWRRTSGCTGGYTAAVLEEVKPISPNGVVLTPEKVLSLVRKMFESQEVYKKSGGVHASALADENEILF